VFGRQCFENYKIWKVKIKKYFFENFLSKKELEKIIFFSKGFKK